MRTTTILATLAILALVAVCGAPLVGGEQVSLGALWGDAEAGQLKILWTLRMPRVAVGFLAGAGLAIAGMAFQAMFRNPLATPFTLGVSSGASLGAAVYIHLGLAFSFLRIPGESWFAFAGALVTIAVVYGLARAARGASNVTMLLAGVAVSFFFSSMILFLQYLSDLTRTFRMVRWVMGGLDVVGLDSVLTVLPFVFAGCAVVLYFRHELNLITTGEELAVARGVEVDRVKFVVFVVVSIMVGAIVSMCGPIGFVGLMAPHICRLLIGPDHRTLTPATILFGGAFLVLCDTVARTVIAPTELPVGILTALLGGPFFVWLLLTRAGRGDWE
ncbi:MAG: iron ABC transporter permease [Planctomycetaceae bacterium]|nr:iron ABC transporter permease [Planctomycetaceae bacterium]